MKINDKVQIISDNENYTKFLNIPLIITHVAHNTEEHPGYDEGMNGQGLYDLKTVDDEAVPFSLYDYELKRLY